jgi:hypothetical protein
MATCPACDHQPAADVSAGDHCAACGAVLVADTVADAGGTSVRPPDHDAVGAAELDRDPLAGWDLADALGPTSSPPPPTWSIIAGTAGVTALVGVVTGILGGRGGPLRRGLSWSLVGAAVAAGALRVWELEPEPASWALAHPRAASGD